MPNDNEPKNRALYGATTAHPARTEPVIALAKERACKGDRPHRAALSMAGPRVDLGLVLHVTLIGCGKSKAPRAQPARALYTGSLFPACLEHALATSNEVRIVSAKHGLLGLDDVVEPYDVRVDDLPDGQSRRSWGENVVQALVSAFPGRALDVTLLMGGAYADLLVPALDEACIAWERPLDGYPTGMRLSWLAGEKRLRVEAAEAAAIETAERAAVEAAEAQCLDAGSAPRPARLFGAHGQLELPHVGPLCRQLALF